MRIRRLGMSVMTKKDEVRPWIIFNLLFTLVSSCVHRREIRTKRPWKKTCSSTSWIRNTFQHKWRAIICSPLFRQQGSQCHTGAPPCIYWLSHQAPSVIYGKLGNLPSCSNPAIFPHSAAEPTPLPRTRTVCMRRRTPRSAGHAADVVDEGQM